MEELLYLMAYHNYFASTFQLQWVFHLKNGVGIVSRFHILGSVVAGWLSLVWWRWYLAVVVRIDAIDLVEEVVEHYVLVYPEIDNVGGLGGRLIGFEFVLLRVAQGSQWS